MNIVKQENGIQIYKQKSSLLEKEIVKNGLSSAEFQIALIGAGDTIANLPDRQFTDGRESGLVYKLGILAKGISKDFSIRNVDEAEAVRFFHIVKKYYSELTISEVRTAFELALVGTLDEYLPKDRDGNPDRNHYQAFSLEFITKILNAYKKYRGKIWGKVYRLESSEVREPSEEEKNQNFEAFVEVIREAYKSFLDEGLINLVYESFVAKWLVKKGFTVDREPSEGEFRKALQNVSLGDKVKKSDIFEIRQEFEKGNIHEAVNLEAERIKSRSLIYEAFENIRSKGLEL